MIRALKTRASHNNCVQSEFSRSEGHSVIETVLSSGSTTTEGGHELGAFTGDAQQSKIPGNTGESIIWQRFTHRLDSSKIRIRTDFPGGTICNVHSAESSHRAIKRGALREGHLSVWGIDLEPIGLRVHSRFLSFDRGRLWDSSQHRQY